MNRLITIFTALFFGVFAQAALADNHATSAEMQMLSTTTSWVNQSGSIASLSFVEIPGRSGTYTVSGYYVNNADGYRCQGTPYPLNGIFDDNTGSISFSVVWTNSTEDCKSFTSWTGYFDWRGSFSEIITKWNLVSASGNGHQILSGSDIFTAQSVLTSEKLISE